MPLGQKELRILIVDDDRPFTAYLSELLQTTDTNITMDFAYDGIATGHKVETFQPDIVLLDLMMPGLDGYAVCRHLKTDPKTESIRIIAMTGAPSTDNIDRILAEGAEDCLAKPIKAEELFNLLGVKKLDRSQISGLG